MQQIAELVAYLLAALGITVLVVWPADGPLARLREAAARRLPRNMRGVLDCYICFSFWVGMGLAPLWWHWYGRNWVWLGGPMVSAVFWILMGKWK